MDALQTTPDLDGFETYYGVAVADIGEEGHLIALGHPHPRRALAAFNRHARTFWGLADLFDGARPDGPLLDTIEQLWAVLMEQCGNPRHDPGTCGDCKEIAEGAWCIDHTARPDTAGAFPVTLWRA